MNPYAGIGEYRRFMGAAEAQKAINSFRGLMEGIAIDGRVDAKEQAELTNWYNLYRGQIDRHPFNELLPAIDLALSDGVLTTDEVSDLLWLCDQVSSGSYYDLITSSVQALHGVIHGLLANNELSTEEVIQLRGWLSDHSILRGTYPFDEIYSLVESVLEDGQVSETERNALKAFFSEFVDIRDSCNLDENELSKLREQYSIQGICTKNPSITIPGHSFCFTGASTRASRVEIAHEISVRGGVFTPSVGKKTEYLIVGSEGNPCWAYSCYGRKVEKAVALRKSGNNIAIVNELDFWETLDNTDSMEVV